MKIGILTYYGVHNYGAVLQANALKKVLQQEGHEVTFLTFTRNYDMTPSKQVNKYKIGLGSIGFYIKYLTEKGLGNITFNLKKSNALKKFRSEYIPLFGRYSDFDGDAIIIGSDEVFSVDVGVNSFLFGHGLPCSKVISYAGCFGSTTAKYLDAHNLNELVASGFRKMDSISVRDKNSQDIVREVSGIEADLVCDPVILYGYKTEMESDKPSIGDYVIVYSYDKNMNSANEISAIRDFAKERKCKIVSVGMYHKWCDRNEVASPIGMVTWIRNAKYVITDTFHGAVVSLLCNTPMVVKIRGNTNKLEFLLSEYGLTDRIVESLNQIDSVVEQDIDFNTVNQKIAERRSASLNFLKEALES
ncbi:MAG: polysaccharide pyruvyl transferase family protein [Oscillospiraceae bacterium]|nr:polysaccharide pyruvyl transferase family protein [Oscillospiraceae bacterium]